MLETLPTDQQTLTDSPSPPTSKHWLIDSKRAKELAQKSVEARQRRAQEAQQAKDIVAQLKADAVVEPSQSYVKERLNLVRAQLKRLDELLGKETDANKIDRLVSAQSRLSEQERILDGRPLPGSNRPKTPAKTQTPAAVGPLD